MLTNIKAAIFDMDGTLVDSMWIWKKIDIDYLKAKGFDFPEDLRENIEHLSFEEVARYFKDRFKLNESIEEIMNTWNNMAFKEYRDNVPLKPGVKEYLSFLKLSGVKIGLATSNCQLLLETVLKRNDIYDYFDSITTTNEVSRGKDFPDVYLLAARKLGVSPSECIVFEDILPAVKGAKSAGMTVVGVHDAYSEDTLEDIKKTADYYIYKYSELNSTAV